MSRRLHAWGPLVVLLVWVLPLPALGAKLIEVRVGRHPGYTRVVLQTDAPVGYTLTRSKTGNVRIELEAEASPRRLASKSEVLREVIVENTGEGSLARLKLHRADVAVKEMVLKSPPRIVLDLTPGVPQPALAAAEEKPAPRAAPAEPKADPAPVAEAAPEPEPESAPVAEAAPEPAKEKAATTGGRLADSKVDPMPEPGTDSGEAPASEPAVAEADAEGGEPSAADEGEATGSDAGAVADAGDTAAETEPPTEGVAKADPTEKSAQLRDMPAPPPARRPSPPEPPPAAAPASSGALAFLPAPLDDPLVLGGIAGLLVLIVALAAVRRRGAARGDEELDSPFGSSEPFAEPVEVAPSSASFDVPAAVADDSPDGDLPAMPGQEPAAEPGELFSPASSGFGDGDSLFSGEAVEAEEEKEADAQAFTPVAAVDVGAAEAPLPGGDVMRVVEELERRMGQMETRLEEVMDAKERLERQVSAQTEELRVQRAAIARTQRVLRNVSRPEDEATEPAPKV